MGSILQAFAAAFLLLLALTTPLRMALGWADVERSGLSARRVEGTIWRGTLRDARFGGLSLGEARARLDLPGLLTGRPGVRLEADGAVQGLGVVRLSSGGFAVTGVEAALPLQALAPNLPIQGRLSVADFDAEFRNGTCRRAGGRVAVAVAGLAPGRPLSGLVLSGAPTCRDGFLTLPLAGQAQGVALEAVIRIDGGGRYRSETRLRATGPALAGVAAAVGFQGGLDGFSRTDEGRLAFAAQGRPIGP